ELVAAGSVIHHLERLDGDMVTAVASAEVELMWCPGGVLEHDGCEVRMLEPDASPFGDQRVGRSCRRRVPGARNLRSARSVGPRSWARPDQRGGRSSTGCGQRRAVAAPGTVTVPAVGAGLLGM